jgi:hypothetical protein
MGLSCMISCLWCLVSQYLHCNISHLQEGYDRQPPPRPELKEEPWWKLRQSGCGVPVIGQCCYYLRAEEKRAKPSLAVGLLRGRGRSLCCWVTCTIWWAAVRYVLFYDTWGYEELMIHDTLAHDTWYMIRYILHDTWYMIHDTWYMIHDTWYMICVNNYVVPSQAAAIEWLPELQPLGHQLPSHLLTAAYKPPSLTKLLLQPTTFTAHGTWHFHYSST